MQTSFSLRYLLAITSALLLLCSGCNTGGPSSSEAVSDSSGNWAEYLGGPGRNQYAAFDQINRDNVHQLEVAWTYHTGDKQTNNRSEIQTNPIIIDGVLYGVSPALKVFALDAATGTPRWTFDPFADWTGEPPQTRSRGVVYWADGDDRRIFLTAGLHLHAINADTGELITSFGENGKVDLRVDLGRESIDLYYQARTPGAVYKDLLILGARVGEGPGPSAPGHVRAFNVRTGAVEWVFHTIPQPGEFGYETWPKDAYTYAGGANPWSGISIDHERGIAYMATGSPSFDFFGGNRHGDNLFGNSILALNAETGERIWHFQVVRHDLWDRDLPAPPNLLTVQHEGRMVDVVAQITKSGHVFVLDRDTGKSLFPLEDKAYPPSDLRGEEAAPSQVLPLKPPPFSRQTFTEDDITNRSPEAHAYVLERFKRIRSGGQFIPPSTEGTLIFPGFDGGGEWGGAAADPTSGILYINGNEMPWILTMVDLSDPNRTSSLGSNVYAVNCAVCHGPDRLGGPQNTFPSLVNVRDSLSKDQVAELLSAGKGAMPSFQFLSGTERDALVAFLFDEEQALPPDTQPVSNDIQYSHTGYNRFTDLEGYPAVKPPWGTLNAIDLNTGEFVWKVVLGEYSELTEQGIPQTGTENYGGPIVTAGGLLFIAATKDEKFRAFDLRNGEVLWEASLPAGGFSTPSTYMVDGKQYVVTAAGGGKMGKKSGDAYVAFALPG